MLCADTSFLFSLYGNDSHTEDAISTLTKAAQPLLLSALNVYELGNSLRFAECRGLLTAGAAAERLHAFDSDRADGRWHLSDVALTDIVAEATRLSSAHTLVGGHRSFDILHVAHARLATPKRFLSFDQNQLRLAKSVGLRH